MTTAEKDVFIRIQNSIVCSKALVLLNCLNTFVHDGRYCAIHDYLASNDVVFLLFQAYDFDLTCKTGIGREFKLHCRAVGVLPPLELSHSVIKMKATAVSDTCSAHIEVINSHTSANEFTHPVPRIGSGPIVQVGSTSFEFVVPAGAPLTISPAVGTVSPGRVG